MTSTAITPSQRITLKPGELLPIPVTVQKPSHPCPASTNPLSLGINCNLARVDVHRVEPGQYHLCEIDLSSTFEEHQGFELQTIISRIEVFYAGLYYRIKLAPPFLLLSYIHSNPTPQNGTKHIVAFNPSPETPLKYRAVIYSHYPTKDGGGKTLMPMSENNLTDKKLRFLCILHHGRKA